MKTKPDDTLITLWMDEELHGKDLDLVEGWVAEHPELLEERKTFQAINASLRDNIPASEEPPYSDFFNQRILRTIEEDRLSEVAKAPTTLIHRKNTMHRFWQWLALPMTAAAMAICFYLGTQQTNPSPVNSTTKVATNTNDKLTELAELAELKLASSVYTPDSHVQADIFESDKAHATVIVLTGLQDIPDEILITGEPTSKKADGMMIQTDHSDYSF